MKRTISCIPLLLMALPTFANSLTGRLSAESGQSDNGNKTADNPVSERQDSLALGLQGDFRNSYLDAGVDYNVNQRHFDQGSQDDRTDLIGNSFIHIGDENRPADVLINYSRESLLQKPDQIGLTDNLDDRGILTVTPTVRAAMGARDVVSISGDFSEIDYKENNLRDSNRKGGILSWSHRLSELSDMQLIGQSTKVSFDEIPQADYNYKKLSAIYSARLRLFSYSIEAGYNRTESELREDITSPFYRANLNYDSGVNSFRIDALKTITDSSMGDGNMISLDSLPIGDGSDNADQFERQKIDLTWTTQIICERCSASISYTHLTDDYVTILETATQEDFRVNLNYRFSRTLGLSLSGINSTREFEENIIGVNYKLTQMQLVLEKQFSQSIVLRLLARNEKRRGDSSEFRYDENYFGINAVYSF